MSGKMRAGYLFMGPLFSVGAAPPTIGKRVLKLLEKKSRQSVTAGEFPSFAFVERLRSRARWGSGVRNNASLRRYAPREVMWLSSEACREQVRGCRARQPGMRSPVRVRPRDPPKIPRIEQATVRSGALGKSGLDDACPGSSSRCSSLEKTATRQSARGRVPSPDREADRWRCTSWTPIRSWEDR